MVLEYSAVCESPVAKPRVFRRSKQATRSIPGSDLQSADGCQHVLRARVVAKRLAHMDKEVLVSGSEDEAAAELKRIFSQAVLLVSGRLGAFPGLGVIAAQKMEQGGIAKL